MNEPQPSESSMKTGWQLWEDLYYLRCDHDRVLKVAEYIDAAKRAGAVEVFRTIIDSPHSDILIDAEELGIKRTEILGTPEEILGAAEGGE